MFESLLNAFRAPDIRRRLLYVLGILSSSGSWPTCRCRASTRRSSRQYLQNNALFGVLDLLSGGGLSSFSVVALGVNPYINASIIMQLMTGVIPQLQALQREGEYGRNKINQYTRYLAVPMALLQSYGFLALLNSQGVLSSGFDLSNFYTITQIITLTAGSLTLMWLGELITEKGIGNGISFIIFAGIVSRTPTAISGFLQTPSAPLVIGFAIVAIAVGRGDHLHPGRPAADPDPVREPRPRPADVPGRPDVPAAPGQPGRRDPDHLRDQHPAVPAADRVLLHELRGRVRRRRSARRSSTS